MVLVCLLSEYVDNGLKIILPPGIIYATWNGDFFFSWENVLTKEFFDQFEVSLFEVVFPNSSHPKSHPILLAR